MLDYVVETKKTANQEGGIQGFASVTFGNSFKIDNIGILKNSEGNLFVTMPKYRTGKVDNKNNPVFDEICNPITAAFRKELYENIIKSFTEGKPVVIGERDSEPLYKVIVSIVNNAESSLKAMGKVVFDNSFVVNSIRIREKDNELYVFMPNIKTGRIKDNYPERKDVCYPVSKEFSKELRESFKNCYQMRVSEKKEEKTTKKTVKSR